LWLCSDNNQGCYRPILKLWRQIEAEAAFYDSSGINPVVLLHAGPCGRLDFIFGITLNSLAVAVGLVVLIVGFKEWRYMPLMFLCGVGVTAWSALLIGFWYVAFFGISWLVRQGDITTITLYAQSLVLAMWIENVTMLLQLACVSVMLYHWGVLFLDLSGCATMFRERIIACTFLGIDVIATASSFGLMINFSLPFSSAEAYKRVSRLEAMFTLFRIVNVTTMVFVFILCMSQIVAIFIMRKRRQFVTPVAKAVVLFAFIFCGFLLRTLYLVGPDQEGGDLSFYFTYQGLSFSLSFIFGQLLISGSFLVMVAGALYAQRKRQHNTVNSASTWESLLSSSENELRPIPKAYEI
jgi:hypothetical protein